jgi:hypothetical protein
MKKLQLEFGGGSDTIIYSVKENRFYSYENDTQKIHNRYGGKLYYSSRTGMSGSGFLEVSPAENDIIIFGYYRTDAKGEQSIATVHTVNDRPVFGYAPFISHGGIDRSNPFIITDGNKVAFVREYEVRETLLKWEGIDGKKISLTYYDEYGNDRELSFTLHNPDHYRGVRATRFIDLWRAREAVKRTTTTSESMFEQKLGIVNNEDRQWFHLSLDGYFDMKWNENPRNIEGEIVAGWNGTGGGLFWRRGHNSVQVLMEIERSSMNGGKYVVEGQTAEWLDYEENFSILEWFSKTTEEWTKYFETKLTAKARQDYVYARQRSGINTRRLMEQNLSFMICIQDSLDTGNCRPGTEEFINRYGIKTDECGCCSVEDLLKNKNIDEMLKNFSFKKVIQNKLVDPEKEIPTVDEDEVSE